MGVDEVGTLNALKAIRRELADPAIAAHHGRVVKTTGDGILIEFPSVVDAVACAVAIQDGMVARNAGVPEDKRIVLRIGINIGDIIIDEGDIHGDGVNIAARLEGIARPGTICLSKAARDQVRDKLDIAFEDMGEQSLKNIARPVHIYRVETHPPQREDADKNKRPALPLPDKPSLAVLPFQNMSGDPDQEYFADGMVEEIITALSRVRSFFVIARNSSFTYKGKSVDVKQVGRELGVRYVLEGSVRKGGNRVRITGQLVEAETGAHLWADRYDGNLDDIFDLQDRVTQSVVTAIAPRLQRAEFARATRKRSEDLTAYDLTLRALQHLWAFSPNEAVTALGLLEDAIKRDPFFAYAYAMAAWCLIRLKIVAGSQWRPEHDVRAVEYATRALRLDEDDPSVLWPVGMTFASIKHDHQYGIELLDRSLAIDPNSAAAWMHRGWRLVWMQRGDEALTAFEHAIRLSPFDFMLYSIHAGIGEAHNTERRHAEAVEWIERAMRENPSYVDSRRSLAAAYARLNQFEKAGAVARQIPEANPNFTVSNWRELGPAAPGPRKEYFLESLRLAGLPE
jgi:adenylate cyclase